MIFLVQFGIDKREFVFFEDYKLHSPGARAYLFQIALEIV